MKKILLCIRTFVCMAVGVVFFVHTQEIASANVSLVPENQQRYVSAFEQASKEPSFKKALAGLHLQSLPVHKIHMTLQEYRISLQQGLSGTQKKIIKKTVHDTLEQVTKKHLSTSFFASKNEYISLAFSNLCILGSFVTATFTTGKSPAYSMLVEMIDADFRAALRSKKNKLHDRKYFRQFPLVRVTKQFRQTIPHISLAKIQPPFNKKRFAHMIVPTTVTFPDMIIKSDTELFSFVFIQ